MKMSDVFYLPVVAISNDRGGRFIPMESNQQAKAAAHAINQHDQLTAINQELVEALSAAISYIDQCPCDPDIYPEQLEAWNKLESINVDELIKRAKELTNEG